jgi:hypothetical protein
MYLGKKKSDDTVLNILSHPNLIQNNSDFAYRCIKSGSSMNLELACNMPQPISPGRGLYSQEESSKNKRNRWFQNLESIRPSPCGFELATRIPSAASPHYPNDAHVPLVFFSLPHTQLMGREKSMSFAQARSVYSHSRLRTAVRRHGSTAALLTESRQLCPHRPMMRKKVVMELGT